MALAYRTRVEGSGRVATANPHNDLLLLAVQGGLPAVALFVWLLVGMAADAAALPGAGERLLGWALAVWLVVGGLFNSMLIDHAESLVFVLLAGVLFAAVPRRRAAAFAATASGRVSA